MCSRFTLIAAPVKIGRMFKLGEIDDFPPRYNIAPTQPVAIVRISFAGARELALVRWGLLPDWVKDPAEFATLFNARGETLLDRASFKSAVKYRRCLFPMSGFYDWSGSKGQRQPVYVSPVDGAPFAVAGLWEHWMGVDGSELETAAIVTVAANRDVAGVSGRMPAILASGDHAAWLDVRAVDAVAAMRLLRPAADGLLQLVPVGTAVNNASNDGPQLVSPVVGDEI